MVTPVDVTWPAVESAATRYSAPEAAAAGSRRQPSEQVGVQDAILTRVHDRRRRAPDCSSGRGRSGRFPRRRWSRRRCRQGGTGAAWRGVERTSRMRLRGGVSGRGSGLQNKTSQRLLTITSPADSFPPSTGFAPASRVRGEGPDPLSTRRCAAPQVSRRTPTAPERDTSGRPWRSPTSIPTANTRSSTAPTASMRWSTMSAGWAWTAWRSPTTATSTRPGRSTRRPRPPRSARSSASRRTWPSAPAASARSHPAPPPFYSHLVLLAQNRTGYKNLIKLSSIGFTEGFYRRPRIDKEVLERALRGDRLPRRLPLGRGGALPAAGQLRGGAPERRPGSPSASARTASGWRSRSTASPRKTS